MLSKVASSKERVKSNRQGQIYNVIWKSEPVTPKIYYGPSNIIVSNWMEDLFSQERVNEMSFIFVKEQ